MVEECEEEEEEGVAEEKDIMGKKHQRRLGKKGTQRKDEENL